MCLLEALSFHSPHLHRLFSLLGVLSLWLQLCLLTLILSFSLLCMSSGYQENANSKEASCSVNRQRHGRGLPPCCLRLTSSADADEDHWDAFSQCNSSGQRKQAQSYLGLMFTIASHSLLDDSRPFPTLALPFSPHRLLGFFFPFLHLPPITR